MGTAKKRKKRRKLNPDCLDLQNASNGSSSGWHTDPDNPILGPDGQLRDTQDRPGQFVHSPLETGANFFCLQANPEDDLPSVLRTDADSIRPKHIRKPVTCTSPLEALAQGKLAAKNKAISSSKKKASEVSGNVPAPLSFQLIPTMPDTPFPNPDMRRQTAHRKLLERQYPSTAGYCTSCGKL